MYRKIKSVTRQICQQAIAYATMPRVLARWRTGVRHNDKKQWHTCQLGGRCKKQKPGVTALLGRRISGLLSSSWAVRKHRSPSGRETPRCAPPRLRPASGFPDSTTSRAEGGCGGRASYKTRRRAPSQIIPFSAFWLRSSVVSVLISLISDMWAMCALRY